MYRRLVYAALPQYTYSHIHNNNIYMYSELRAQCIHILSYYYYIIYILRRRIYKRTTRGGHVHADSDPKTVTRIITRVQRPTTLSDHRHHTRATRPVLLVRCIAIIIIIIITRVYVTRLNAPKAGARCMRHTRARTHGVWPRGPLHGRWRKKSAPIASTVHIII